MNLAAGTVGRGSQPQMSFRLKLSSIDFFHS
jgi:hypothetical protein